MNYILGLNTLRFLSFLGIFLFHTTTFFTIGYLGVDFFFVLSSFLLTFLALKEMENTNSFSQVNFVVRRALRIFPLYYFIIAFSFFVLPMLASYFGESPKLPEHKALYWLLLSNYETSDCVYYLKFLWSIAVEEQFYLMFVGLSFLLFRKISILILIFMVSYSVFLFVADRNGFETYFNTLAHLPNFTIGIVGGYLFFKKKVFDVLPEMMLAVSMVPLFLFSHQVIFDAGISIFFLSLILLVNKHSSRLKNIYAFKLTEELGRYTYGLYVYSGLVITFVSKQSLVTNEYVLFFMELLITILLALASYHLYEKHFLKLKNHFR